MQLEERWRPVVEYEGCYSVSDAGRVRSEYVRSRTRNPDGVLSQLRDHHAKPMVVLWRAGTKRQREIHRLVWEAFEGPVPVGFFVSFVDGDKSNSALSNLELLPLAGRSRRSIRLSDRDLVALSAERAGGETLCRLVIRWDIPIWSVRKALLEQLQSTTSST